MDLQIIHHFLNQIQDNWIQILDNWIQMMTMCLIQLEILRSFDQEILKVVHFVLDDFEH